eukprot:1145823-Pelagomonas_calceolata.AAC.7
MVRNWIRLWLAPRKEEEQISQVQLRAWAVLAAGESVFYFHILSIKEESFDQFQPVVYVLFSSILHMSCCPCNAMQGFVGRAVLALYDRADEIRCQVVSVESMGKFVKGYGVTGPDFVAEQGCKFVSVNNMGEVVIKQREEPGIA